MGSIIQVVKSTFTRFCSFSTRLAFETPSKLVLSVPQLLCFSKFLSLYQDAAVFIVAQILAGFVPCRKRKVRIGGLTTGARFEQITTFELK